VRDRHSAYYCAWLGQREPELKGRRHLAAGAAITLEIENVRSAWRWAAGQGNAARLDQALEALCVYFWELYSNRQDAAAACQLAAQGLATDRSAAARHTLAKLLAWQVFFTDAATTSLPTIDELLQQSHDILHSPVLADQDTRAGKALLLRVRGLSTSRQGTLEKALDPLTQSVALYRALGDDHQLAWALHWAEWANRNSGRYDRARALGTQNLARAQKLGLRVTGWILIHMSALDAIAGDFAGAERRLEEAIVFWQDHNNPGGVARALRDLGTLAALQGRFEEAETYHRRSIELWRHSGNPYFLTVTLAVASEAFAWRARFDQAHAHLAEALALVKQIALPKLEARLVAQHARADLYAGAYQEARSNAETALATAREIGIRTYPVDVGPVLSVTLAVLGWLALLDGAYQEARALCSDSLAAYRVVRMPPLNQELVAWSRVGLGLALNGLEDKAAARSQLYQALREAREVRAFVPLLHLLPTIPLLLADEGADALQERAVELYALAKTQPFVAHSPLVEEIAGKPIAAKTATLPPEVIAAAQERGRALDWWETARRLQNELPALGWAGANQPKPSQGIERESLTENR
jgi:tetratricopeptide (TPR) repeat protein